MDEPTNPSEPVKKKRGWQKGRKRGPRKPQTAPVAPPAPTTAPDLIAPQTPTQAKWEPPRVEPPEPVLVEGTLTNGQGIRFSASTFLVQNGRYVFTSYPAQRGYKRVTVLKADQLAMLAVTAPEDTAAKLLEQQQTAPQPFVQPFPGNPEPTGAGVGSGPIVFGPPLQRPPYADPRQPWKDPRAESAQTIPNAPGIPMSEISGSGDREVFGDHKKPQMRQTEVIRATMG